MNQRKAIDQLKKWDKFGKYVFRKHELKKIFPDDKKKTFEEGLNRLVKYGILCRACRGIYINLEASSNRGYTIEHVAKALRPGDYNYLSLESALSEYGLISQAPVDRLTVMTTGRSSLFKTPFGVIEFVHTKRKVSDILENTIISEERPLRIALKKTAWRDLKRVGRNIEMVDKEGLYETSQE